MPPPRPHDSNGASMPHSAPGSDAPAIRGLFDFRPETAHPLNALVQVLLRGESTQDVAAARAGGAADLEIHDTVLIAAAFRMYNRYADGLARSRPTRTPRAPSE